MRVLVLVKATAESEDGVLPTTEMLERMGKYNQELIDAGIIVAAEGALPSAKGMRMKFQGEERTLTDGPFKQTKDLIAGFWLWEVKSMQEAVQWLKRAPFEDGTEVELRPVFAPDDFGDNATPEMRAEEEVQRKSVERANKNRR